MTYSIESLQIYPWRMCPPVTVPALKLVRNRIAGNNEFVLVHDKGPEKGHMVDPGRIDPAVADHVAFERSSANRLKLRLSDGRAFRVDIGTKTWPFIGDDLLANIYRDFSVHSHVDAFLSEFLGHKVRLCHFPEMRIHRKADGTPRPGHDISIRDAWDSRAGGMAERFRLLAEQEPVLISSRASMAFATACLPDILERKEHRICPNILLKDACAMEELRLSFIRAGQVKFEMRDTLAHMAVQFKASGSTHPDDLAGKYAHEMHRKQGGGPFDNLTPGRAFAVFARNENEGIIRIRDRIRVLEWRPVPDNNKIVPRQS